jgi:hypothetical protein
VSTLTDLSNNTWKDINQRPNGTIHISLVFLVTTFKQSNEQESIKNQLKISKRKSDSKTRKYLKKPNKEPKNRRKKKVASFIEDTH